MTTDPKPIFLRVDPAVHMKDILTVTTEYFEWMNHEIENLCKLSIPEIVGMSLAEYVQITIRTICSSHPPEGVFYLIICGDAVAGSGGLRRLPDGTAEIVRIFTRPEYRGRGYGAQLMALLLEDAKAFGYQTVKLDTGDFMRSAHRIYGALGFKDSAPYEGAEPPPLLIPYWRYMTLNIDS